MTETPELSSNQTEDIVERIEAGEVFVYPTDTAYGLGASIRDPAAVRTVFSLKRRSFDRTVPVLTSRSKALELSQPGPAERAAIDRYWPGGLTLVTEAKENESSPPGILREGTIALRVPDHDLLRQILQESPPITGTSANYSGQSTPYEREQLEETLVESVDFILDGQAGSDESSSVVERDRENQEWIIHRAGPVTAEELDEV
jgi:tRNA threonylcarbamoyl adenosine modification protein (Sua5/YciO/YrdC/YwlC family)